MRTRRRTRPAQLLIGSLILMGALGGLAGCGAPASPAEQGAVVAARPGAAHLDVVGLGDSVVAGSACDCRTFVQRYATLVAARTGARVQWHNDGVGGQTSGGLLSQLRPSGSDSDSDSDSEQDDVRGADVVLITIGANDLAPALTSWQDGACGTACMVQDLPRLRRNVTAIVARVQQLSGDRHALIAVTDYWNVFEDGQVADTDYGRGFAAWSDRITRLANDAICSAASAATACVDLYGPFNGGDNDPTPLLAEDGDHPDAAGHQVIAEAIARAVLPAGGTSTS